MIEDYWDDKGKVRHKGAKAKRPKITPKTVFTKTRLTRLGIAALIIISVFATALGLEQLLSNVINTGITVVSPQQVSISLQAWAPQVVNGLNYSFAIRAVNNNPNLPNVLWVFNFTRGDGVRFDDFDIYMVQGNQTVKLNKIIVENKLMIFSDRIVLPSGEKVYEFIIVGKRNGAYSISIALSR